MSAAKKDKQRGIALLMVLIALAILGSMTADFLETNEVYLATAVNARDAKKAEYMAKSGINLARLTLSFQELLGKTSNFPFWQYSDLIIPMFTSKDGGVLGDLTGGGLAGGEGLGIKGVDEDAELEVVIVDEESKININLANETVRGNGAKQMVEQLTVLTQSEDFNFIFDREMTNDGVTGREDIICEIIDWSDGNEDLCDNSGSEDRSLYTNMEPPYERKNAPFDSLEELHLVAGINDDFWSAFVDPDPEDPNKRNMTIWGKGRININTAPPQVLYAIICDLTTDESGIGPCQQPDTAVNVMVLLSFVDMWRKFMPFSSFNELAAAFSNPERLGLIDVTPIPFNRSKMSSMRGFLTARSSTFSIYSKATVGRVTKRIHMVIDTKQEDTLQLPEEQSLNLAGGKVLYYRME
jgi:general secretion pathway protein K